MVRESDGAKLPAHSGGVRGRRRGGEGIGCVMAKVWERYCVSDGVLGPILWGDEDEVQMKAEAATERYLQLHGTGGEVMSEGKRTLMLSQVGKPPLPTRS